MSIDSNPTAIGLIIAGLLAPFIYAVTVMIGGAMRPGYSHFGNAISELVESNAPHRRALNTAFFVYNACTIALGIGITAVAPNPTIVLSGWVLGVTGLLGVVMAWLPMDPIGTPATGAGFGHLVIAGLMSVGSMAAVLAFAIGSARIDGWNAFSVYSYATFGVVLVTGGAAALSARGLWRSMGLLERLTIGAFLQWHAALAIMLLTR